MKHSSASAVVVVTANRILRAELASGGIELKSAARGPGDSFARAVAAGLALGKTAGSVWVLGEEVFTQRVTLNPAQIAGLSASQLEQALAFEVEPFSGIPMAEGVVGFYSESAGNFAVVELPRSEVDTLLTTVATAGGKLAGVAHAAAVPDTDEAARGWLKNWLAQLDAGQIPIITPPAAAPSPRRFLYTGVALTAVALAAVLLPMGWYAKQRKELNTRNAALASAGRDFTSVTQRTQQLVSEQAVITRSETQRENLVARRGAVLALLKAVATHRSEHMVIREISAGAPSGLLVIGYSLEASTVDELCITLTERLRDIGWGVQLEHKTGTNRLANGGPWEFSLIVNHRDDAPLGTTVQAQPSNE